MLISLSSCIESQFPVRGNGIIVTKTRRSGMFFKVENSASIDIVYKKADTTSITLRADENILEYIVTETNNNTLEIKIKPQNTYLEFTERPLIIITSPKLETIGMAGSGAFIANEMTGDNVILEISGSGNISVDTVNCSDLTLILSGSGSINIKDNQSKGADMLLSGSGNINIKGQSEDCQIKISGSGEVFGENLLLLSANVIISGSGNVFISVENTLTGIISGSGNIYLKGNPEITQTTSGSGRIIKY